MKIRVFDSEGTGLNWSCTKLHNLCYTEDGKEFKYTTDPSEMTKWLKEPNVLWVGHNVLSHDRKAFIASLGVDIGWENFIDTVALTWYFLPDDKKYGLEALGLKYFKLKKVEVSEDQWAGGPEELMKARVIRDVEINWHLWKMFERRLKELYDE